MCSPLLECDDFLIIISLLDEANDVVLVEVGDPSKDFGVGIQNHGPTGKSKETLISTYM